MGSTAFSLSVMEYFEGISPQLSGTHIQHFRTVCMEAPRCGLSENSES